ncbi:TRAP transporter small permease subunit [Neptunomonas concharum]|uniref:TRAP transporter small permease protein n=1 Tax=Neptunomonas concharum TaxID=1031538 RepID=A0A5P1R8Q8_9GAMM|nr:TRAP transporter small permease subunit [Neptunomonas concharum]QEQ95977.1 TRAP transporter small permease subunit [Neptunomonas concharum]
MTENDTLPSVPLADKIDRFIQRIGMSVAWCYVLLVLVIILQVVLRKGFSSGLIIFEELQWHLYAVGVMFGLSYAQTTNSHIRVDLFYTHFRARTKHIIEIIGILTLVLPFIAIVFMHSIDFFVDSYRINESSDSPSGLPFRWIIKGVIPVSFALLGLAVLSRLYRDTVLLLRGE